MKKIFLFFVFIAQINMLFSGQNEYIQAGLLHNGYGMFSVVFYITGIMREYETKNYAGVNVDFERKGLYYQKKYGPNWWNYYFEPIAFSSDHLKKKDFTIKQPQMSSFIESYDREKNSKLINKYIHVKKHILDKVESFVLDNFGSKYVIGVHYRGTDKACEAPRVEYSVALNEIKKHISKNTLKNYLIFLATDEQQFVDYLERKLKGKIIKYNCHRSQNNEAIHFYGNDKYKIGEEAIIDCLLLSKCNFLIRTSSNLSLCSTFFNPKLPVLELSKRL